MIQGRENVKPFSASWLTWIFYKVIHVENVKLETGFSDQESMEQFLKYPLSVIQKKMGYVKEQVFDTDETGLFYKGTDYNIIDVDIGIDIGNNYMI